MIPVILIPAFKPDLKLLQTFENLQTEGFSKIVIVDDGSPKSDFGHLFEKLQSTSAIVLRHAINLGKGAALKTGINDIANRYGDDVIVITVDADGQHLAKDVKSVFTEIEKHPDSLVLGSRIFNKKDIPFRSRFGNIITKFVFRILSGTSVSDTQTGLRAFTIKNGLKFLSITSNRYEFEMEMLVRLKSHEIPIREIPISSVYIEENRSSHFNPILDSFRIYFVLLRFTASSLLTMLTDNSVFIIMQLLGNSVFTSQLAARLVALALNFTLVRRFVFQSKKGIISTLLPFAVLVATFFFVSYGMIKLFESALGIPPIPGKLIAEGILFFASFTIQRDIIFFKRPS